MDSAAAAVRRALFPWGLLLMAAAGAAVFTFAAGAADFCSCALLVRVASWSHCLRWSLDESSWDLFFIFLGHLPVTFLGVVHRLWIFDPMAVQTFVPLRGWLGKSAFALA